MNNSIRRIYISKRKALTPEFINASGSSMLSIFKASFLNDYKNFMTYIPINNEAYVTEINKHLINSVKAVSVPVTDKDDFLTPVMLNDFSNTVLGKYQIPEPAELIVTELSDIEVVLVPGVVFDKNGGRTGYGKGCYDRFLKNKNLLKIGVCYEFQIHDSNLKLEKHDVSMNYLLTEKALYEV